MPTIFSYAGHRVVIYSNDHRPAHVHVLGSGCEAVFELACPWGPPCLREMMVIRKSTWAGLPGR